MNNYPSIFNDVIGPVMRGPSSSHCAAALRIGRLARDLMENDISHVRVEYDLNGALATTHESHGSDMGLFGGLLGWDARDERLPNSSTAIREAGIQVQIVIKKTGDAHPNTYRLTLQNPREIHLMIAVSTGGGMIEIVQIDDVPILISGDYWETLVWVKSPPQAELDRFLSGLDAEAVQKYPLPHHHLIQIKTRAPVIDKKLRQLPAEITCKKRLAPVLPVLSRKDLSVPFITCDGMRDYDANRTSFLWQLATEYEASRGGLGPDDVRSRMLDIVAIVKSSIAEGLAGTHYKNRILGYQSGKYAALSKKGALLDGGALNRMIRNITALMEVKSAMGIIVAAPTAGACAALPGAVVGVAEEMGIDDERVAEAMLAGGLVGVFIAARSTFAAEVCGCQAECGAASGMAAAALASLANGNLNQCIAAASMALQNILGLICDPVANRVEVPCLGRNIMAAANALSCANMALADFNPIIPLDEVIKAMDQVGRSIPRSLRCTALGGLSITPTAKAIENELGFLQEK